LGPGGSPCGGIDIALIAATKRSSAYRMIRPRIAVPYPCDGWYEEACACIVFDLRPDDEPSPLHERWIAPAIFVVDRASGRVLAARVVEMAAGNARPVVRDLLAADGP